MTVGDAAPSSGDPRLEALAHLQRAALEVIEAARAVLDLAEDVVRSPGGLAAVVAGTVGTFAGLAGGWRPPHRPDAPDRPDAGDRPDGRDRDARDRPEAGDRPDGGDGPDGDGDRAVRADLTGDPPGGAEGSDGAPVARPAPRRGPAPAPRPARGVQHIRIS
jgi:hypothetical protein